MRTKIDERKLGMLLALGAIGMVFLGHQAGQAYRDRAFVDEPRDEPEGVGQSLLVFAAGNAGLLLLGDFLIAAVKGDHG